MREIDKFIVIYLDEEFEGKILLKSVVLFINLKYSINENNL